LNDSSCFSAPSSPCISPCSSPYSYGQDPTNHERQINNQTLDFQNLPVSNSDVLLSDEDIGSKYQGKFQGCLKNLKEKLQSERTHPYKSRRKNYGKSLSLSKQCESPLKQDHPISVEKAKPKPKRFEWSAELHEYFIRAYESLSLNGYPTPKQIMVQMEAIGATPLMTGLTRIHVNTHLQKYELSNVQTPKRQSKFFAFRTKKCPLKLPNTFLTILQNSTSNAAGPIFHTNICNDLNRAIAIPSVVSAIDKVQAD